MSCRAPLSPVHSERPPGGGVRARWWRLGRVRDCVYWWPCQRARAVSLLRVVRLVGWMNAELRSSPCRNCVSFGRLQCGLCVNVACWQLAQELRERNPIEFEQGVVLQAPVMQVNPPYFELLFAFFFDFSFFRPLAPAARRVRLSVAARRGDRRGVWFPVCPPARGVGRGSPRRSRLSLSHTRCLPGVRTARAPPARTRPGYNHGTRKVSTVASRWSHIADARAPAAVPRTRQRGSRSMLCVCPA